MPTSFSAARPSLGYLYQVRYALFLLLQAPIDAALSVERLDDVAFESEGTPLELLQLKHHVTRIGALTDSSTDLWRTLRVWCTGLSTDRVISPTTRLTLVTTAEAPPGSAASYLRPGAGRSPADALNLLRNVCSSSTNRENQSAYKAFSALTGQVQEALLNNIYVLDCSPEIDRVAADIKHELRWAVRPEHLDGLYERVEGWWFGQVITHLLSQPGNQPPLYACVLHSLVRETAEQMRSDSLPVDYLGSDGVASDTIDDERHFVQQLRLVLLSDRRIKNAVQDYYRSYTQRSRWLRDNLVSINEIANYESVLVEEWSRYRDFAVESLSDSATEAEFRECGKRIFNHIELTLNIPIRFNVAARYVMRGSYHILADERPPRVWWHPKYHEVAAGNPNQAGDDKGGPE